MYTWEHIIIHAWMQEWFYRLLWQPLAKLLQCFDLMREFNSQAMGEMLKQHLEYMHMWVTSMEQAWLQQAHLLESVIVQLESLVHTKWLLCCQTPSSLSHQTSHAAHLGNLTTPAITNPLSFWDAERSRHYTLQKTEMTYKMVENGPDLSLQNLRGNWFAYVTGNSISANSQVLWISVREGRYIHSCSSRSFQQHQRHIPNSSEIFSSDFI